MGHRLALDPYRTMAIRCNDIWTTPYLVILLWYSTNKLHAIKKSINETQSEYFHISLCTLQMEHNNSPFKISFDRPQSSHSSREIRFSCRLARISRQPAPYLHGGQMKHKTRRNPIDIYVLLSEALHRKIERWTSWVALSVLKVGWNGPIELPVGSVSGKYHFEKSG